MTLTNGSSGAGGIPGGTNFTMPLDAAGLSAAANMQILLQTNNDLMMAIHKAIAENTQETNRKIENLRDDIRDIKLNLQKNDNTLKEEAGNWRSHTELLLKEQGDRHIQNTDRLMDMIMKLVIGGSTQPPPMPVSAAPLATSLFGVTPASADISYVPPIPAMAETDIKPKAPVLSKPAEPLTATIAAPLTIAASEQRLPAFTTGNGSTTGGILFGGQGQKMPIGFKPAELVTTTIPSSMTNITGITAPLQSIAPTTTAGEGLFGVGNKGSFSDLCSIASQPTPVTTSVAPKDFRFKQQEPVGFKPAVAPITTTTTTTTSSVTNITATTQPSLPAFGISGGTLFGGENKGTSFADLAKKSESGGGGLFGGGFGSTASKPQFGASAFGSATSQNFKLFSSPQLNASARSSIKGADESRGGDDESDKEEETPEDYTPDAHYEPVIELPPEVDVVSGEEGEEVMFQARCKLYRFDRESKENKERGLGDIKILKNMNTQKYRCLMRREKVLKLCANFPIVDELKLHQREQMPTVYTWACKDFSEDQMNGQDETFTVRFKDVNIAMEFNEKVNEAIEQMKHY